MKKFYAAVAAVLAALVLLGAAVQPGSKIADYPHATNLNDTDWFIVSQSGVTKSMSGALVRSVTTNLAGQIITNLTIINDFRAYRTSTFNTIITTNATFVSSNTVFDSTFIFNGVIITNISQGGGATFTGSTNFLNLSVQAAKLPNTNYVGIEPGWQDWELLYYKTNAEGSVASLSGSWQFIVPPDYATNSMKVRIYSSLASTNGPNSSNTIFRASVLRATPGDATDLHTASFGSSVSGTTTWAASFNGTNKVQSVVISMSTTSALAPGDLCILKVDRDAATDTYGGVAALVGLQLEYTRP